MSAHVAEKRPLGAMGRMGVVAALHVAVLFVIAQALVFKEAEKGPPTIHGALIDEPNRPDPPPRVGPSDDSLTTRVFVPQPLFPPEEVEEGSTAPTQVTGEIIETQRIEPAGPTIVDVRADPRYPLTRPPYPPSETRAGNAGTAEIEIYVLPNGRVGDARIVRSTGFPRLDQAAIDEAKRKWRMLPATRDGEPFAQWHRLRVTFELTNQ